GDLNGAQDIFVRDLLSGTTERVSVDSSGVEGDAGSARACISADGRFVAFESGAGNLVADDGDSINDIFAHDRMSGATERSSVSSAGVPADSASFDPAISGDGRFVAFESRSVNLVPADHNSSNDIFVHDRETGLTERVSVDSSGVEGNGDSFMPAIS